MKAWAWGAGAIAVMSMLTGAVACGGGSGGTGGGGGSGGTGGTNPTTSHSSSSSSSSSSSGSDPCADLTDCSACSDGNTCSSCCDDSEPDASLKLTTYLIDNCICQDTSPCAAACATDAGKSPACADPNAGVPQGCIDCVNSEISAQGQCVKDTVMACTNDAACSPILGCYQSCPQ